MSSTTSEDEENQPRRCSCNCTNCEEHDNKLPHECNQGHRPSTPGLKKSFKPWKWTAMRRQIKFLERSAKNLRESLEEMRKKRKGAEEEDKEEKRE